MSLLKIKNSFAAFWTLCTLLMAPFIVKSQGPVPPPTLQGKSFDVLLIPNNTVNAGEIFFRRDSDNDGMTDEDEARNGTNPIDPSDADGDLDGDGVSNGDEVGLGTNPNSVDSDGDGVSDADEIRLGYDPLDPNSTPPPNTTIVSLQVTPASLGLVINTVFGTRPVQLTITGITNTGTTVNLTNDSNTIYQSLNQSIAVVNNSGEVFGLSNGATELRVQNGNLTATASVNVATFAPSAWSYVQIPGYANNVDVAGNYAYVAAGATGLQIVDISDRYNPQIVASLDTSGNANDVRVVGSFAYVADGSSGLQIINVTNPLTPTLTGAINTPGEAQDVVVANSRAYIADGNAGLQIIDISNPSIPAVLGALDTQNIARGVDVSANYVVIADDSASSGAIRVIDVANPASPQLAGSVLVPSNAKDVVVRGNLAYVAAYIGGLQIVDFSSPGSPVVVGSLDSNDLGYFVPRDIEVQDDFAFAAEQRFGNAVPIVNVATPSDPQYRGVIDFTGLGDYAGTGIALDSEYVYMTGENFIVQSENGVSGDTRLFIGRHQILDDLNGVPPAVSLTSPTAGQTVKEGKTLNLRANASDDVYVAGVHFKIDGNVIATDSSRPYEYDFQVPLNATSLSATATAFDLGGNSTTTTPVSVLVTPDPPPSVNITNPTEGTVLVQGQSILLAADASDDEGITRVRFVADGNEIASLFTSPYETSYTVPTDISSLTIEARATDTVDRTSTATRTFSVIPDPNTTVTGRVLTTVGQPVVGANVTVFGNFTAQTGADGTFAIPNVPTVRGDIVAKAVATLDGTASANASVPVAPVSGATTNTGDIRLSIAPTAPTVIASGYFGTRDENVFVGQDLFVAYPDRLSSIYSYDGAGFTQRTVEQMEIGSVTAGTSSSFSFQNWFGDSQVFAQLKGQPDVVTKFNTTNRNAITRNQITTGLASESDYVSLGLDSASQQEILAFVSNAGVGGAVLKLKIGNNEALSVPLPANITLHSLVLSDVDSNGFADILGIEHLSNSTVKLIVIKRNSSGELEPAIESDIVERSVNPINGLNNLVVGNFANTNGAEIAVLGDDRVRIYRTATTGGFEFHEEILLPGGQIPTGIYAYGLTNSGYSDLLVTTRDSGSPELRSLLVFLNGNGGGGDNTFLETNGIRRGAKTVDFLNPKSGAITQFSLPLTRTYTISASSGDTRIIVGNWGGDSSRLDVVIFDGAEIKIFLDISPVIFSS